MHMYLPLPHSIIIRLCCTISLLYVCTVQDGNGDTALHCAVLAQKNESVSILLEAGADPTLFNFRLFMPRHEAARIGFLQ